MTGKGVSMRKTREVLRLHFDLRLGQRQIGRSANLSQSTVHDYLERFTGAGLSWPLPAHMTEARLEAALFPASAGHGSTGSEFPVVPAENSRVVPADALGGTGTASAGDPAGALAARDAIGERTRSDAP